VVFQENLVAASTFTAQLGEVWWTSHPEDAGGAANAEIRPYANAPVSTPVFSAASPTVYASYRRNVAVGETLTMQFEIDPIRGTCNVSLTVDLDAADTQCVVAVA
jgi:hypothetical protein